MRRYIIIQLIHHAGYRFHRQGHTCHMKNSRQKSSRRKQKHLFCIPAIMKLAHASKAIITFSFLVSVVYNVVGLYIAVQGAMRPMVAAILMPLSTISIVLITTGVSHLLAKYYGLSLKN